MAANDLPLELPRGVWCRCGHRKSAHFYEGVRCVMGDCRCATYDDAVAEPVGGHAPANPTPTGTVVIGGAEAMGLDPVWPEGTS